MRTPALMMLALLALATSPATGAVAGTPGATDEASASGLWDGVLSPWFGSDSADIDGDGDIDVFLNPHQSLKQSAAVMENDGTGHYSEAFVLPDRDRHGCDWADVDRDGLLDMYCAIGASTGTGIKNNELWMQQDDGTFIDKAAAYGVRDPVGRARNAAFLEVNGDGWPDLYVRNDYPRKDGLPTPSRLFINEGGASFRPAREMGLDLELSAAYATSACIQILDVDRDGRDDILTCDWHDLYLFRNRDGTRFVDKAAEYRIADRRWVDAELIDINMDGRLDLVGVRPNGVFIQHGGRRGTFGALFKLIPGTAFRWMATGDINGDGYPDLYATATNPSKDLTGVDMPDQLFINDGNGALKPVDSPQADPSSSGSAVEAIDVDGDDSVEFLVMSGRHVTLGPLQLIDWG